MRIRKFNCAQQELFAVCIDGWESCSLHLDKFRVYKGKYTEVFVKERRTDIDNVMKMPSQHQRSAQAEQSRLDLKNRANACLHAWSKLRTHIEEAWPGEEQSIKLKAAGLPSYRKACKRQWEACLSMMTEAGTFIADNRERLMANNNMSKVFADEFSKLAAEYQKDFTRYQNSVKQGTMLTAGKLEAANRLYNDLMSMFRDAQVIFRGDPVMLRLFTFDLVLVKVTGQATAGIKGYISNGKLPVEEIPGLELHIAETGDSIRPDPDGSFLLRLAAGPYTVKVTAPGYKALVKDVTVSTGTHTVLNLVLEQEDV